MRKIVVGICVLFLIVSCKNGRNTIVDRVFVDSLISNYGQPRAIAANEKELMFWKDRIDSKNPGLVNEARYAALLISRFQLSGDMQDVKASDSILNKTNLLFNHKEASVILALVRHSILQHRFSEADSFLMDAKNAGLKKYELFTNSFDVNFELGRYPLAENELKDLKSTADYGYYFRRSKMDHFNGNIDSSIHAMLKAAELAGNDDQLKQAALSNAADLYIHDNDLKKAYELYVDCVHFNSADLHSIMGIGWIALVHDNNDSLAQKIFEFLRTRTKSPDPLFKLVQVAEAKEDVIEERKYAKEFENKVSDSIYGNMYNKYLIDLYTGILNDAGKAESISKNELSNRATPQTYAWYAWSLFSNNKKDEAYAVFEKYVSGKPLEGLELYWMGKMMQGLGKGYNAREFFKAAYRNRYDLSPAKIKDINKSLEE